MKTLIIAEAGVNHNGNIKTAMKMIDVAVKANADFIKFQTFIPEKLVKENCSLTKYQKKNTNFKNQLQMLKKLSLSFNDFKKIKKKCDNKKIEFMSSPFDEDSIEFLKKIKVRYIKIPSGEITNIPYLEKIGRLNLKVVISTGMSNMSELIIALKILIKNGTKKKNITVLHCSSEYPAKINELNLCSIKYIKDKLNIKVGYSDHSIGYEASLIALGLGASILEKHFTLNKKLSGPDHKASLSPSELNKYVFKIRTFEKSIGKYHKKPGSSEMKNMNFIRKKIVAKKAILKGEKFNIENITTARSSQGLSASKWYQLIGKKAKHSFLKNQNIKL